MWKCIENNSTFWHTIYLYLPTITTTILFLALRGNITFYTLYLSLKEIDILRYHHWVPYKSQLAETELTMASKYQQTIGIKVKRVTNTHKLVPHRIINPDSSQIHPHYNPVPTLIWILKISFKSWPTMSRNKIKSDIRSVTPNI